MSDNNDVGLSGSQQLVSVGQTPASNVVLHNNNTTGVSGKPLHATEPPVTLHHVPASGIQTQLHSPLTSSDHAADTHTHSPSHTEKPDRIPVTVNHVPASEIQTQLHSTLTTNHSATDGSYQEATSNEEIQSPATSTSNNSSAQPKSSEKANIEDERDNETKGKDPSKLIQEKPDGPVSTNGSQDNKTTITITIILSAKFDEFGDIETASGFLNNNGEVRNITMNGRTIVKGEINNHIDQAKLNEMVQTFSEQKKTEIPSVAVSPVAEAKSGAVSPSVAENKSGAVSPSVAENKSGASSSASSTEISGAVSPSVAEAKSSTGENPEEEKKPEEKKGGSASRQNTLQRRSQRKNTSRKFKYLRRYVVE